MPFCQIRLSSRSVLLAGAAAFLLVDGAAAADKPATPEGAKKIGEFFSTYGGKGVAAPPALVVTPEGADYAIAFDLGAINIPTAGGDFGYAPAVLKLKAFEQGDGAWRVEQSEMPPISAHSKQGDASIQSTVTIGAVHSVAVFDPTTSWMRSSTGTISNLSLHQSGPGIESTINIATVDVAGSGKSTPDGAVGMDGKESFGAVSMTMSVDPKAANPKANADAKPFDIKMLADRGEIGVNLDGVKIKPLLDLWAFLVAHPTRAELAADEAVLKTLATASLGGQPSIGEDLAMPKLTVTSRNGDFVFEGLTGGFALAAAGPASRYEQHFAAANLTLPAGLIPPMYSALVPTTFDIGFKVSGFDLTAAGVEAISDMHLAGDAPPISKDDNTKVLAKLVGAGPVTVDITRSHLVAPQLDIAIDGKLVYAKGKPTGVLNVHVRNFDKTVAALKSLGPDAEKQMAPVMAMAKGLAKTEADGTLGWVGEIGADGVMKVNGLPLGKSPF